MRFYLFPLLLLAHYSFSQNFSQTEISAFGSFTFDDFESGDYDKDGDLDFVGLRRHVTPSLVLFRNNGDGDFNEIVLSYTYFQSAQLEWADIDYDNDLDIVIAGCGGSCYYNDYAVTILRNEGNDKFADARHNLPPASAISIADFSSDGNPDVVLYIKDTGYKFFRNNGNNSFDQVYETLNLGDQIYWSDFNNDGHRDFALGKLLFKNNGDGGFTKIDLGFFNNGLSFYTWIDIDTDGDEDFFRTATTVGSYDPNTGSAPGGSWLEAFENLGNSNFQSRGTVDSLRGFSNTVVADFDADGDSDLAISGFGGANSQKNTRMLWNEGNWSFTVESLVDHAYAMPINGGDYDMDGDHDLLLSGIFLAKTFILKNEGVTNPTSPVIPVNLTEQASNQWLTLAWDISGTPPLTNEYNFFIRKDSQFIVTPQSDVFSGSSYIPGIANNGKLNQRTIDLSKLAEGYYNWSVQSLSRDHNTSPFAYEGEFTVYKNNSSSAPSDLRVSAITTSTVSLTWNDRSSDETAYVVERSDNSGNGNFTAIATLLANTESFTDVSLTPNHFYYYRIRAQRPEVSLSSIVRAKTLPYLDDEPFNLNAMSPGSGKVSLNWNYDGTNHQGFIVFRSIDNKDNFIATDTLSVSTLSFMDTGLDGFLNYYYRIAAFHTVGNSDYSNIASATTPMQEFEEIIQPTLDPVKGETSLSWGDYDNDGFDDLFLANKTQLFKNNGDGTFVKKDNSGIVFKETSYYRATSAWGDYDNDGFLDIIVSNSTGETILYRSNGDGTFKAAHCSISLNRSEISSLNWVDFDNDGDLDLILSDYNAALSYYRYDGNDIFTNIALPTSGNFSTVNSVAVTDFDGDGGTDIFAGSAGTDILLKNNYPADFSVVTDSRVISDSELPCCRFATPYAAWSDFNNDLIPDLTIINAEHYDFIYKGGKNGLDSAYAFDTGNSLSSPFVFWEDFDNDGDVDLMNLLPHYNSHKIFENLGPRGLLERRNGLFNNQLAGFFALSWIDYNNDGYSDLISLKSDGPAAFYKNVPNGNKWLKIRLVGTASNSKGVGAKIFVKAGGSWQRKDVVTNHSQNVQQGFAMIFGLRKATIVDSIRVEWPSGALQTLTAVGVDQAIVVRESQAQVQPFYKPINLTGSIQPFTTIKLFWEDKSSDEEGFEIQKSDDGMNFTNIGSVGSDMEEFVVNNLQTGKTYYFRVRAFNGSHFSNWTNVYKGKITLFSNIDLGPITRNELRTMGVSWSDFTGDEMADLFFMSNLEDALYTSAASGVLNRHAQVTNPPTYSRSGAWGDFDNDGNSDLFVAAVENKKLYKNTGGGQLINLSTDPAVTDGLGSQMGAWGDLNKDGYIDLLVSTDQELLRYVNNKGTGFQPADNGTVDYPGTLITLSDFDKDDDLDLFAVMQSEGLKIWENQDGEFRTPYMGTTFMRTTGFCLDDFDGDNDFDLVSVGEGVHFYRFDSFDNTFKEEETPFSNTAGNYYSCTAADFDNNGHLDILITNSLGGKVYLNEGGDTFREHLGEDIENFENIGSVASSDHDRDGDIDLFVCSPSYASTNYFLSSNGTDNNWCEVKLVGHTSNRDGIGAKVKIVDQDLSQVREVRTNTGSYSGNEQIAHFGLGVNADVDYIKVEWPSGHEQWIKNPAINTLLIIEEGDGDEPPAKPAAPTNLTAVMTHYSSVDLQWKDNSSNETAFAIERSLEGGPYREAVRLPVGTTSYTDDYFEYPHPALSVSYRVAAAVDDILSDYSNEVTVAIPVTGVEDATVDVDVYPNPVKEKILIRSSSQPDEIKIVDSKGTVMYHSFPHQADDYIEIMTTNFRNGIFLLVVRSGDTVTTRKIIVSK